ncbi:hypothetical protein BDL97_18G090000 [Sphagnum fallax]|nr:hypothetical protein BDL97_18G090000 [Sphagnum fallax]
MGNEFFLFGSELFSLLIFATFGNVASKNINGDKQMYSKLGLVKVVHVSNNNLMTSLSLLGFSNFNWRNYPMCSKMDSQSAFVVRDIWAIILRANLGL